MPNRSDNRRLVPHGLTPTNKATALLDVTAVEGNGDANDVVRVANAGGAITGGAPAHTFVHSPVWFTGLGNGVRWSSRTARQPARVRPLACHGQGHGRPG